MFLLNYPLTLLLTTYVTFRVFSLLFTTILGAPASGQRMLLYCPVQCSHYISWQIN